MIRHYRNRPALIAWMAGAAALGSVLALGWITIKAFVTVNSQPTCIVLDKDCLK